MKNAAIYCRVSTDNQERENMSFWNKPKWRGVNK